VDITYRVPTLDDIESLAALGSGTFVETFGDLYAPEDLNAFLKEAYSVRAIRADIENPLRQYLVAEDDGVMAGYCKIGDGVSLDYDPQGKKVTELKQLYLLPDYFGRGIADHMMQWAEERARKLGADEMLLSVFSENFRAQKFYKRHGFAFHADTIFMVGGHEDHEFLFLKALK